MTAPLGKILEDLATNGFSVVPGFVPQPLTSALRAALDRAWEAFDATVPAARRAGERGVVRLPMLFEPAFLDLLALPRLLEIVDGALSPTAILHLQNGIRLEPSTSAEAVFQERFHRDFPRWIGGERLSVNVLVALDDFTADNGATQVVPRSHQRPDDTLDPRTAATAIPILGPAGTALVFDSTLWHRGGENRSRSVRRALNHQFTRSYLRQQIDYPRALPRAATDGLPERTRQLLGFHVRVPTSLEEYYRAPDERLYRAGQG